MTYRIYLEYCRYDRSTDAILGAGYRLAHPYTFENLSCALAFRAKVWKKVRAEYGDDADELGVVVLDEKGRTRYSDPARPSKKPDYNDEIPF